MSKTINLRQTREATENKKAQYESPDVDGERQAVCTMYAVPAIAESLGEFAALTVDADEGGEATNTGDSTNYGVYTSESGAIEGLYISREVLGVETDEDVPETVTLSFEPSDQETFEASASDEEEAVEEAQEEEAAAFLAGGSETDESDESEDEEVEVSDEELGIPGE